VILCLIPLILPGFGVISNVLANGSKKTIFGYLGMVYGVPLCLLFRCVVSQLHTNTFSIYIESVIGVAIMATCCGKAPIDSKLRFIVYITKTI
jgi:heme/copper-type cytochrome/quinol oxidase subunit 1